MYQVTHQQSHPHQVPLLWILAVAASANALASLAILVVLWKAAL